MQFGAEAHIMLSLAMPLIRIAIHMSTTSKILFTPLALSLIFAPCLSWGQMSLPIFDLTAQLKLAPDNKYHIVGSFRVDRKIDFEMSGVDAPSFFFSSVTPTDEQPLTRNWHLVPSRRTDKVFVEVISDTTIDFPTAAIIRFDVTPEQDQLVRAADHSVLATVGGFCVLLGPDRPTADFGSALEWSFAVTSLDGPLLGGPDTNNILPVGLTFGERQSKFAIGSDDQTLYLYTPFSDWHLHGRLDSTPVSFGLNTIGTPSNFLSEDWTPLRQQDSNYRLLPHNGRRDFKVSHSPRYQYFMSYCPDVSDIQGLRYFQIGGVIRDMRTR